MALGDRESPVRFVVRSAARTLALGVALAVTLGLLGWLWELGRFGNDDAAAFDRLEAEVRAGIAETIASMDAIATGVADLPETRRALVEGPAPGEALFDALALAVPTGALDDAVTVFNAAGDPLAWRGRPSELTPAQLQSTASIFVVTGPLGLRLAAVRGVSPSEGEPRRIGVVAVEREVATAPANRIAPGQGFLLETSMVDVSIDLPSAVTEPEADVDFTLEAPAGGPLFHGRVAPGALSAARGAWRRQVASWMAILLGLSLILACGALLDRRDTARGPATYRTTVGSLVVACLLARLIFALALPGQWHRGSGPSEIALAPVNLLLTALFWLALVVLAADAIVRWRRLQRHARRSLDRQTGGWRRFYTEQFAVGVATAAFIVGHALLVGRVIQSTRVDVLKLSPHPWDADRLTILAALTVLHAAAFWGVALLFLASRSRWRLDGRDRHLRLARGGAWLAPIGAVALVGALLDQELPGWPLVVTVAVAAWVSGVGPRALGRYRHASQATRLVSLFIVFLTPALVVYPTTLHFADRAERRRIETEYARQTSDHPADLELWLSQSLAKIDDLTELRNMAVSWPAFSPAAQRDSAFQIWRQTDLAEFRLTSAVELYAPDGRLVSRFALNVPEYAATPPRSTLGCGWEIFGEASTFGATDRQMLHAQRSICVEDSDLPRRVGAIVLHLMLDYRVLPFIASDTPYEQLIRDGVPVVADPWSQDVEVVIYGWGYRRPLFASGRDAWALDQATFERIRASRDAFWTSLDKGGVSYDVHLSNDSAGIYALGVPARRPVDVLINLAEIVTLVGALFIVLLLGVAGFRRVVGRTSGSARRLFEELRASFYRKLSLAFMAAAVVPVLTLAFVIRLTFTAQLRADVEAEAIRTAAVARRVIEEIALLQPLADGTVTLLSDDVMVWISEVIDQDVNIFDGPRLVATSERDLYASGLLPTRTPEDVYRGIALQRLPSWVGVDQLGDLRYVLAATPVGATDRETILTVPLTSRQQQIERQIDDLDRGIQLGVVAFVLLGGVIGLSMAERIADPLRRLTRVTTQIARGDFDVRVAVRSADELQRLVQAFNTMAAELKSQRAELKRTHRLEAWAEMARQVAHEIKNPLTPIQLSAEHLRRVHADRGSPLAPVLDSCIDSILTQVRLLRQISAEFWSFATAPTARPALIRLHDLVQEVVQPYRIGLGDRVEIAVDVPSELPSLLLDRTLTARALTNIIENALHAMPGQGVLRIAARREDSAVRLSVTDTGVGMGEDALARIFEPYFSTRASGTGLGLTIAKRNIELSGGSISLDSAPGVGTTVTLRLSLDGSPDASG